MPTQDTPTLDRQIQIQTAKPAYHLSWSHLTLLFFIALFLFLSFRWQPEIWLREQIRAASEPYGVSIDYKQLQRDGTGVQLQTVHVSGGALPMALDFDSIRMTPAWTKLIRMTPAADVVLVWHGVTFSSRLSLDQGQISLSNIRFQHSVSELAGLLNMPLPVLLGGSLHLSGDLTLNQQDGRPVDGALQGQWLQAAGSLSGKPELLGDYTFDLTHPDDKLDWRWQLSGGDGLILKGDGTVRMASAVPAQWIINGKLDVAPAQSLPAALRPFLTKPMQFSLSGPLFQAVLQPR